MVWVDLVEGEFAYSDLFARYTEISGLTISEVILGGDRLTMRFTDGRALIIEDTGQSCCENRYMDCDDDLTAIAGGHLVHIELSEPGHTDEDDNYGCHEVQFLKVQTTNGFFTCCTHNEHNGYYGGFSIEMKLTA